MAKNTTEDFPAFEDWTPPWGDEEVDADKVARLVYNARKAEHKLKVKVDDKEEKLAELTTAVETYRDAEAAAKREGETETQALERKIEELTKKINEKPAGDDLAVVRLELALEHGLTKRQAARLVGNDRDELEEDAEALVEELGLKVESTDENEDEAGDDENEDAVKLRRRPKSRAAGDPDPGKTPEVDVFKNIDDLVPRA